MALTRHRDLSYLRQIMQAGASGYMLKQAAAQVLIGAIRIVAAGGTYLDPDLAGRVLHGYLGQQGPRELCKEVVLSEREEEVVRLIAWGRNNKGAACDQRQYRRVS